MAQKITKPIYFRVPPDFKDEVECLAELNNNTVTALLLKILQPIVKRELRKIKNDL
jgi:hypothetical protein